MTNAKIAEILISAAYKTRDKSQSKALRFLASAVAPCRKIPLKYREGQASELVRKARRHLKGGAKVIASWVEAMMRADCE